MRENAQEEKRERKQPLTIAGDSFLRRELADVCGNLPQVWKDVHRQMLENWMQGGTMVQLEMENDND